MNTEYNSQVVVAHHPHTRKGRFDSQNIGKIEYTPYYNPLSNSS